MTTQQDILSFWFQGIGDQIPGPTLLQFWFASPEGTDEIIIDRFAKAHQQAVRGELDSWPETAHGRLAAILLIDQFSRNIHRGSAEAFAQDHRALAWCKKGIELGHDQKLTMAEKTFFYLPLEHSESVGDQNHCVAAYQEMVDTAEGEAQTYAKNLVKFADEHRVIIAEFGRFPHRNAVLGRESTPEEVAYLADGGARFGQ